MPWLRVYISLMGDTSINPRGCVFQETHEMHKVFVTVRNTAGWSPQCLLWETQPILVTFVWACLGDTTPEQSRVVRAVLWLCGMESRGKEEPPSKAEPVIASLEENPLVKTILDINLIVCVSCAVFIWGYFA